MVKKTQASVRKRAPRATPRPAARLRLREEFRSYARAVILEAGEEVLADHGLHVARMEEVAKKARVAVGTIYNLIGDRDALVLEILRLRHEQLVALLTRKLEEVRSAPFREQAHACVISVFDYFGEHRRFFQLMHESERGPACAAKRASQQTVSQLRDLFRELIGRGVKQRVLRAEGRELLPPLLMGMIRELITFDLETQHSSSSEERATQLLHIFIHGAGVA
jgi:AcrR family transcriptional regulator